MTFQSKNKGLARIWLAFGYSVSGLISTFRTEAAFRQELLLLVCAAPLAFWLGSDLLEKAILLAAILLVLVVELLNSAIESVVDRHGEEYHELAGKAKDQGSAAVLLALIIAALVWFGVLLK